MSSDHPPADMTEKIGKRILIADDRPDNRYFLQSLLTGHGYQVLSTKDGQEALEILKNEVVDAIITDILMPVLDGYDLCQLVKKDPNLAKIPFIFYTASYTEERHRIFGLSLGADEYLCKPSEPDDLLAIVRKYV